MAAAARRSTAAASLRAAVAAKQVALCSQGTTTIGLVEAAVHDSSEDDG